MNKSTDITPPKGAARPPKKVVGVKETSAEKMARIPIKIIPQPTIRKPEWIRMKMPNSKRYQDIKQAYAITIYIRFVKRPVARILASALAEALLLL